jgi:hypothetical protein
MTVRLYTGEDGQSYFETLPLPFVWEGSRERTPLQGATGGQIHPVACRPFRRLA